MNNILNRETYLSFINERRTTVKSQETFIKQAKEVHGDKYDYSKVNYVNGHSKVKIICPKHGEFEQTPNKHLMGQGCPECGKYTSRDHSKETKEGFIKKSQEVHKNDDGTPKYDYSKVDFVDNKTKVCIICPIHGEFYQSPKDHKSGYGCPDCGRLSLTSKMTMDREQFIQKSIEVHKNDDGTPKYDYSDVDYKGMHKKVKIICPIHGEFWQQPTHHIHGTGCPDCGNDKISKLKTMSQEEFVQRAYEVHDGKYDYSKVEYKGAKEKVCIICPEHGEFWQSPSGHLSGAGCPKCRDSKLEKEVRKHFPEFESQKTFDWLKFNRNMYLDFYVDDLKLAIECQGIQHFDINSKFFTQDVMDRDVKKFEECRKKEIEVIYYFPKIFANKFQVDFYNDKKCFYTIDELEAYINNKKSGLKS